MNQTGKYIILGLGHGINDCIAGFIIGSLFYHGFTTTELGIYTLVYNLIAFGGQLVVARIIESYFFPKNNLFASFSLLIGSLICLNMYPAISILFSGIASAIFHVTGGLEASREDDKSFGIGLFASPGILGLISGGFLSYIHFDFTLLGILLCLVYLLVIGVFYKPSHQFINLSEHEPEIERHDVIMCILITVISLRSFVWDIMQMVEQNNYKWLIIIAISAMCGKIMGGFIADKIGHKRFSIYALVIALPFLTILKKNIFTLSIGVFLLQSTIPSTTVMVLQTIKRKPALAISLSFGLSILIAISLFYTPIIAYIDNNIAVTLTLLLSIILLTLYSKIMRTKRKSLD